MTRKQSQSIYASMYSITLLVVLAFFAHNALEAVNYDVLNINYGFELGGYHFFIQDIFPFYDAPKYNHYGDPTRLDLQVYVFRLSNKLITLALTVGMYRLSRALNIFLAEIPGRKFVRLPYILIVLVCLFAYELLDFLFFAGQSNWMFQALATVMALLAIVIFKKD
jgi:hypothetical protein